MHPSGDVWLTVALIAGSWHCLVPVDAPLSLGRDRLPVGTAPTPCRCPGPVPCLRSVSIKVKQMDEN